MPSIALSNPPVLLRFLVVFFVFGAVMASLTAVMLLFPGSILEPVWRLNPRAHDGLATIGAWAVAGMVIVATVCASTAVGLWRRARWGYVSAIVVLSINLFGDTMNAIILHDWRTLIGLPIGGAMIMYLVGKRRMFG